MIQLIAERQCWSKGYDEEKVTRLKQEWIANWCETKNQKYLNKATLVQNMQDETTEEVDSWEDTYQKVLKGKTNYFDTLIFWFSHEGCKEQPK